MLANALWVVYVNNVPPLVFTARLVTVEPAGLTLQSLLFTDDRLDTLRERMVPGRHRIGAPLAGVSVPAGNTLVEVWV